ncbi:MAG TPA: hypothetical protein VNA15_07575 [Candidatus Angelobacter sp.]|nr:hypothetical protein [Candidatus Angelobacter sp.]
MEHQFRKVMSKLEKNPQKGRPELARFSKELKQIMSDYGNTEAKLPHYTFPARRMLRSFAIGHALGGIEK